MEPERPTARSSPARGVALIATAVVLGLFIVRSGFEDDTAASGETPATEGTETGGSTTAPPAGGGGEGGATTTAPAAQARPAAEVTVLVANASGVSGAAGELTTAIADEGYQTVPGTNAPPESDPATTQVLHIAGFEQEGAALAGAIGATGGASAMADPPPVELGGAQILVILGTDLANG
jgi:hypothetical protein